MLLCCDCVAIVKKHKPVVTLTLPVNDLEAWTARNTLERANRVHTLLPRTLKLILTLVHIWACRKDTHINMSSSLKLNNRLKKKVGRKQKWSKQKKNGTFKVVLEVNVLNEWEIIHRSRRYMTKSMRTPDHRTHILYHSSKLPNCCRKAESTHLSRTTLYITL